MRVDIGEDTLDGGLIRYVRECRGDRVALHVAFGFEQRVDGLLARIADMHARAGIDERTRDHEADARCAARHEHAQAGVRFQHL